MKNLWLSGIVFLSCVLFVLVGCGGNESDTGAQSFPFIDKEKSPGFVPPYEAATLPWNGGDRVPFDAPLVQGELKKLLASDGALGDKFGNAVAISGDYAIVGAINDDYSLSDTGAAYILAKDQGGTDNWGVVKKLTAPDGGGSDNFGVSVSISGTYAVVGSYYNDAPAANSGSAYLFAKDEGGANNWGLVKKLLASDGANGDQFGIAVSISGNYVSVGADRDDDMGSNSGSVYVFSKDTGGANNWGELKKITASDGAADDGFGSSLSIAAGDAGYFTFNAAASNYVSVPNSVSLSFDQKLTLTTWARWDSDPATGANWANIVSKGQSVSGWKIQHNQYNDKFEFSVRTVTNNYIFIAGTTKPVQGAWYQVTGVYDGTALLIYVNGVLENQRTATGAIVTTADNLNIGRNGAGDRYFNGSVDEVMVFNDALTASEIADLYNLGRDPGSYTGAKSTALISHWRADTGTANDDKGTNNGTLMNGATTFTERGLIMVGAHMDDDRGTNSGAVYVFAQDQGGVDNWGEFKKITASDGTAGDFFGNSVAISRSFAVVGALYEDDYAANSGAAYVFSKDQGGTDNWGLAKKIHAADGAIDDNFGISVALNGQYIAVGAYNDDVPDTNSGSAYLFSKDQGGKDTWGQLKRIIPSDGAATDQFGIAVSISAKNFLTGAEFDDDMGTDSGSAYIFGKDNGGANNWGQLKKALPFDDAPADNFGIIVSISGNYAVVGSSGDDNYGTDSGSAYLFSRNQGGANNWGLVKRFTASDAASFDRFGSAVSISGDYILVGSQGDDDLGSTSGSAYIFYKDQGGIDNWGQQKKLLAPDGAADDSFGVSVSLNGDRVIVGAHHDDNPGSNQGSAYIFYKDQGGTDNWGLVKKLSASNGEVNDQYGISVSISGDRAVVGAYYRDIYGSNSGAAYVYHKDRGGADNWGEQRILVPADGASGDQFGNAVAISGDALIVGAYGNDNVGTNTGAAYVFAKDAGGTDNWGLAKKLLASDGGTGDQFGVFVAISGTSAIVGADYDDDRGADAGAAYLFNKDVGGTDNWGEMTKTLASDGQANDHLGYAVSIDGNYALVGAYLDDDKGTNAGSAYIFPTYASKSNGATCSINAECGTGYCTDGACCAAATCDDGNVCTVDSCAVSGNGTCTNTAKADGFTCNDGNACTQTDTCQSGNCTGSNPVTCTASDQCHDTGTCNPADGTCSDPAKTDGTACVDGNGCTQTDTCQSGTCTGSNPVTCTASDQCHSAGTCNPADGTCSDPAKTDGTACVDGNGCTQTDTCQSGSCTGSNPVTCTASDQCHDTGTCNPADGTCSDPAKPNGSACVDGNGCTQTDTCQSGSCTGSNPVTCSASDQCHDTGTCNPADGTCSDPAKPNGSACVDGNGCTQTDTCQAGTCTGSNPVTCTASDQCHDTGTCNPADGTCSDPAKTDGTACVDGNGCTQTDTCQAGTCTGSNPVTCTASDQCHDTGTCNPADGTCSDPAKTDGTACVDGNGCTQTDTCQAGTCTGSNPVTCNASDQCHDTGTCNPADGTCSDPVKPNGTACVDGNGCTQTDTCQAGTCTGSNPVTCNASDQCHDTGSCNPADGTCSDPVKPNGTACVDGNGCTQTDTCQAGTCTGSNPVTCNDSNPCTDDSCDTVTGCVYANNTAPCSDGDFCNGSEVCGGGTCQPGSYPCGAQGCSEATDECVDCLVDGDCNDGQFCTGADSCVVGACVSAGDPCTGGGLLCSEAGDTCVECLTNADCADNGTFCDGAEVCNAGSCESAGYPCGTQLCNETVDTCVDCLENSHCDNGAYCDGTEYCLLGACEVSAVPCGTDQFCVEAEDTCVECLVDGDCSDGNACNGTETCAVGICSAGIVPDCNDGNICTDDSCVPVGGCQHADNTDPCGDGDFCNGDEVCGGGVCGAGSYPCGAQLCDELANACVDCLTADNCDNVTYCDGAETCSLGVCLAGTYPCDTKLCDEPKETCVDCLVDGDCTDGDACNGDERCDDLGLCNAGNALDCNDGNICTDDSCDAVVGCEWANNTLSCDDGNALTENDTCNEGTCNGILMSGICGNTIVVNALPYTATGTTAGRPSALENYGLACVADTQPTADIVYEMTVETGVEYQILVNPTDGGDLALNLIGACGESEACLAAANVGGVGEVEVFTYTAAQSGTVYIVIEGTGAYELAVTTVTQPDEDSVMLDDVLPDTAADDIVTDIVMVDEDTVTADDIVTDTAVDDIVLDTIVVDEDTTDVEPVDDGTVTPDEDTVDVEPVDDGTVTPDEDTVDVEPVDDGTVTPDEDTVDVEPVDDGTVTTDEDVVVTDDGQPTDSDAMQSDTDTVKPDADKVDKDTVTDEDTEQPDETVDELADGDGLLDDGDALVPDDLKKPKNDGCGCSVIF